MVESGTDVEWVEAVDVGPLLCVERQDGRGRRSGPGPSIHDPATRDAGQNTAKSEDAEIKARPSRATRKKYDGDGARRAGAIIHPRALRLPELPNIGRPYRVRPPPPKHPRTLATIGLWTGPIRVALTSLEVRFVPIRSTRRQCSFVFITRGDKAACLQERFAKEGTVIGSKPSWIGKSVLEGYAAIGVVRGR
jgi:hypothetical protein